MDNTLVDKSDHEVRALDLPELATYEKTRVLDVNAHISNIDCKIAVSEGAPIAAVSFDNLGYGTISAIKFLAKGFDSFEDEVLIAGSNSFLLVIQDICIPPNSAAEGLKVSLPNSDIRRLELRESQVCFENGQVLSYEGNEEIEFVQQVLDETVEGNLLHDALKERFGDSFKYIPTELEQGWVCGCGRFNQSESGICNCCGAKKVNLFEAASKDAQTVIIQEYQDAINKKKGEATALAVAKEKHKRRTVKRVLAGAACLIAIIVAIAMVSPYLGRKHFHSEQEMSNAIAGVYTEDGSDPHSMQLKIEGGKMIWRLDRSDTNLDIDLTITSYDPSNGTFMVDGSEVIVTDNGALQFLDNVYRKGGSWTKLSTTSKSGTSSKYESAYTALTISGSISNSGSSYTHYNGTIKNTGSKTYKYVQVKGSFKDRSGSVVDTDWTYAVGSEGLAPGESKTFSLSVRKNSSIKDCSVSIIDYD